MTLVIAHYICILRQPLKRGRISSLLWLFPHKLLLPFGSPDKAAHDWMSIDVKQAGDAVPCWVVSALQDLIGRYLDPLTFDGDPIAAFGIHLVVRRLTISLR